MVDERTTWRPRPAPAERPAGAASSYGAVAALAATAGNRAVGGLLQREPDQGTGPAAAPAPTPSLTLDPDYVRKRQEEISGRVRQHLQTQREVLLAEIAKGLPMPELVDAVRRQVPDAT